MLDGRPSQKVVRSETIRKLLSKELGRLISVRRTRKPPTSPYKFIDEDLKFVPVPNCYSTKEIVNRSRFGPAFKFVANRGSHDAKPLAQGAM